MADRIPLIVDSSSNQVKELPAGDSIILADNEKIKIGTGSDLNVYHDGSNSFIDETGTGNLYVKSNSVLYAMGDDIRLMNAGNSETLLQAVVNGAVTLRYDNTARIATTATGIDVTGNVIYSGGSLTVEAALTDGSTVSWDVTASPVAKVTLAGNRTLDLPSNPLGSGQYASLLVIQDGTGSRTLTWNAAYEFKDDTAPTLTTTASKGDLFTFRYNGAKWLEVGRNQNLSLS
jgi:hypothetical protein